MKLSEWIEEVGGLTQASFILRVATSTIYNWKIGRTTPNYRTMLKIIKASKGRITIEEIVVETNKRRKGIAKC